MTTFRMLSVCGALGYGYDETSLENSMKLKLDLVASDAGSMDAGPYYLGKGEFYFPREALKRDFSLMVKAAIKQKCPLILGTCGMAGDDAHLNYMIDIAKEVFEELGVKDVKVATVSSHIDSSLIKDEIDQLVPLGKMPDVSDETLKESAIVGQMGIAPFITALKEGAQIILCGRSCDVAIFAAPAILNGIDPGLAYHTGHILECGALACDPGSASDCLIAECESDKVIFVAPNKTRRVTPKSIAAHSLYEESHPCLQFYPEGVLVMENTEYFSITDNTAGIKNSIFIHTPLSLKLEGSRKIGERYISLLFCQPDSKIPKEYITYGINGVEEHPVHDNEKEIGILIKATSNNEKAAEALASLIKGYMLHYGYPNRRTTAGNILFPISPSTLSFKTKDGNYTALVIAATREPLFIQRYEEIKSKVVELAKTNFPDIYHQCSLEILTADVNHPLLFLDTVGKTKVEAEKKHNEALIKLEPIVDLKATSFRHIYGGSVYVWSIYHLLKNSEIIKKLFPVKLYRVTGKDWKFIKQVQPDYQDIGMSHKDYKGSLDERKVNLIKKVEHRNQPIRKKSLLEMATVIRSKDAGVNTITYDIFFKSEEDYKIALQSNAFTIDAIAKVLNIPSDLIIGTYHVDTCNAIKISRYRKKVSGTPGTRDVFGSQQQLEIEEMQIPIYKD